MADQQSPLASQRAKQAGNAPPKGGYFPMGYKEGFSQWWASITPAAAEHKVLSFCPYLLQAPTQMQTGVATGSNADSKDDTSHGTSLSKTGSRDDPYGPRKWHSSLVKLAGKDRALNEFSVERVGENVENTLVMLHGYGAGLGFFYKNFEPLSRDKGWKLYALDLLGMGRSSRPPFKIHAKDRQGKITEAENWFVDSLEEWRKERNIDRFTLLGHSMGGYMAVAYALKYPGRLNKLILASPVGIPEDPYATHADMPEPEESTLASEITQDQSQSASKGDNNNFLNSKSNGTVDTDGKPKRKPLPKWLTYLWDANISPFAFVRWSGPLGPRLVSGWTSRRFSQMPKEEADALHDYAYTLFKQRGSGEFALAYILAPGAFARSPLIRRIGGVGRQWIPREGEQREKENGLPVVMMYGENDWMDVNGGYEALDKMRAAKNKLLEQATEEEKQRDQGSAKVLVVKGAGHHVYLDGWEEFNSMIRDEMKDVEGREKARRT
ncbi:hypothetical protein FH972_021578 [Carpinus fangiana]|uniref:AB hydrolase-1 domain-containing protein n=1 Tax=Carpinus fangiana TaxID=176857 RepID=A0A5N6KRW3_9ROSI|nr:hypothetical protein FH972_021578 [Carpinus fangiana]